jgi:uncharacterized membrane-anchored protein
VLRVGGRSSVLAPKLRPGDIAVLDHVDLDGATAQTLLARKVAAVVNVSPSTSGRYPNLGPTLLVDAGVALLDAVGHHVLTDLRDGRPARIDGDTLWVEDEPVACGTRHDEASVGEARARARAGTAAQLADLAMNASGFLLDEKDALLGAVGVPALTGSVTGRTVVVVGPAYDAAEDLARLRRLVRRRKAFLVGVDGGADLVLAAGHRLDLAVGDPSVMSDEALRSAGQVVLRAGDEGLDRVHDLAVPVSVMRTRAATEDMALLLVRDAAAVVLAGVPRDLEELLDRGRDAAASSLLVRFALTRALVPPAAAAQLVPRRRWVWPLLCVVLAGLLVASVVIGQDALVDRWNDLRL